ncbi:peptide/nickel transport system substrate-binding protein [Kibdelosporangium banguiense]|uniref:Peptide/nickel transport system substrate-binding protein n=1 Tax=Kibdelosporangium banguiense TaxID=1365924 RepID=A0ABS4TU35_9PSEU|nr:ABC transporter substrate-binding protein [Kibdelosporangium banguiense]MBP2327461.1 peptide/nickel transport system substrate-binding protein [Kibdelosporangium banguiense]
MLVRRRRVGALFAISVLVAMPLAVGGTAGAQDRKTLRAGVTQDLDSLNPFITITRVGTDLTRLNYEYLTTYDPKDYHPVPGLAESWETSADKLTWTFKIRSGAKWSDGQPITAKDPAFTLNTMMTNDTAATANGNFVQGWESVTATDEHTLVIKTKEPRSTMLALDIPIVPEHVWSKVTDFKAEPPLPLVGSGPFIVQDYKASQFIKLKANKDYWRGAAKIDALDFVYYKNVDAEVQALKKGEIDLMSRLVPAQYDALKSDPNIKLNTGAGRRLNEILINPGATSSDNKPIGDGNPALKDKTLRQAIALSIDSKTLVDKVWGGYAVEAAGYIPPGFSEFHLPEKRKFDPATANKMLDEAGYTKGADGIRNDKQGKPLKLRLLGHAGTNLDEQGSKFITSWLKDIGIAVEPQLVSDQKVNDATTAATFDLSFSGWSANPDPDYVLSLQTCAARPNADGKGATPDSFLCDPEYDALYNQQLAEVDRAKRVETVKKMQQVMADRAANVIIGYDNPLEAYRADRWAPFQTQPAGGGVIMNQQGYWGYYSATPGKSTEDTSAPQQQDSASNTGLVLGVVGGSVVVVVAGVLLFTRLRRRGTADERE